MFQLQIGACLEELDGEQNATVGVTPCDNEHRAEVIARFTLDDGAYPGADRVVAAAEQGCADASQVSEGRPVGPVGRLPCWPIGRLLGRHGIGGVQYEGEVT